MNNNGMITRIMRYSLHDGPGIRTTVFFKGCPLNCWWCHNPECQKTSREWAWQAERCRVCERCLRACPYQALRRTEGSMIRHTNLCQECGGCVDACLTGALSWIGRWVTPGEVMEEVLKDLIFYEESGGGVTLSGGEPLMQPDFLETILRLLKHQELHAAVDTSGYAPLSILQRIAPWVGLFLFDIKHMDDDTHRRYTGVSNEPILRNLKWLLEEGLPVMVSIPIIPGVNDDEAHLDQVGDYLSRTGAPVSVRLLPYHATGTGKYPRLGRAYRLDEIETPDDERLRALSLRLGAYGIQATQGET